MPLTHLEGFRRERLNPGVPLCSLSPSNLDFRSERMAQNQFLVLLGIVALLVLAGLVLMLFTVRRRPGEDLAHLGIPIGTVMSRLSRGRQALRAQLAHCGARAGIVRDAARPAGAQAS